MLFYYAIKKHCNCIKYKGCAVTNTLRILNLRSLTDFDTGVIMMTYSFCIK